MPNGAASFEVVALSDFCKELGLDRGGAKKAVEALERKTGRQFMRKGRVRDNQPGWVLTREHADEVIALRREAGFTIGPRADRSGSGYVTASTAQPTVYLLGLHGNRIKIGFSDAFDQRIAAHRTLVPDLIIIRCWSLPQAYEVVFLDIARSTMGVVEVGPEVFSIDPDALVTLLAVLDGVVQHAGKGGA